MLITPSLLHVKTRSSRGQQEDAALLVPSKAAQGFDIDGMTPDDVFKRLDVAVMRQGPEMTEWQCIRDDHASMADAGEWDDLLDALRFADQSRTVASGGKRVATLISEGARATLDRSIARKDWTASQAELLRFEAVCEISPKDYVAAHLLAQAHIDLACAKRGAATVGQLSREMWAESAAHFDAAEDILAVFDPIEEMSPLLAATRYMLVRGIEDGRSLCRDWFEDWCDLDPEDADVHAAHARHMLPQWFGSLACFDKEARKASLMTEGVTGNAAYAVFHLTAANILGDLPDGMDLELFLEGLTDYQTATGCQHRANVAASLLTEMVHSYRIQGPAKAYHLTKVRAALSDTLWNRLTEVHLSSWESGANSLAFALGEIFGPALKRGARIGVRGHGLGTLMPMA
jgi:hypothetical protein